jgi:hypothetical protein
MCSRERILYTAGTMLSRITLLLLLLVALIVFIYSFESVTPEDRAYCEHVGEEAIIFDRIRDRPSIIITKAMRF